MRECHIEPDWLLVYKVVQDVLVLKLIRTGSHSDLFKLKQRICEKQSVQQAAFLRANSSKADNIVDIVSVRFHTKSLVRKPVRNVLLERDCLSR